MLFRRFVKESLLWLYANDKRKEASELLRKAMTTNGITDLELAATDDGTKSSGSTGDKARDYRTVPSLDTPTADPSDNMSANVNSQLESRGDNPSGYPMVLLGDAADSKNCTAVGVKSGRKKLNIIDLLRNKSTRKIVPIICFTW